MSYVVLFDAEPEIIPANVHVMNFDNYHENANSLALSESKFAGSICLEILSGKVCGILNATRFITKNKKLSLVSGLSRVKNINYVTDSELIMKLGIKSITKISDIDQLSQLVNNVASAEILANIKVSCGFNANFAINEKIYNGHITVGYGITLDESLHRKNINSIIMGETTGYVVGLKINNKDGGYVVKINCDIHDVPIPHITVNTDIKSVLSSKLLEKYIQGSLEFKLSDIDACKKDLDLCLCLVDSATKINIISWYEYMI